MPGVPERFLRGPTGVFFLGLLLIVLTFFLPGGIVYGARKLRSRVVTVTPVRPDRAGTGGGGRIEPVTTAEREDGAERALAHRDATSASPVSTSTQATNHQGETS